MDSRTSLRELLAKASPLRSGDILAGVAADNDEERVRAQMALAETPLKRFLEEPVVPYEEDEITRLILDGHDAAAFAPVSSFTVGDLRDWLLTAAADAANGQSPSTSRPARITPPAANPAMPEAARKPRQKRAEANLRRSAPAIFPAATTGSSVFTAPICDFP